MVFNKNHIPTKVYDNFAKLGYNVFQFCEENNLELKDLKKILEDLK